MAIVRLSGERAIELAETISGRSANRLEHGRMRFCTFRDGDGADIDRGYIVVFRAPRSMTGEDIAECHVHGSMAVVARLLDALVSAGARPARRGEFSMRAFVGGKLDLTQAEGLLDLVSARSEAARKLAIDHLDGRLSELLETLRSPLVRALAETEARLDFAGEEDVDDLDRPGLAEDVELSAARMRHLAATARAGRIRAHGVRVAMYGAPNVGKSTLFNALVGSDRALVHDEPGTTRDLLEAPGLVEELQVTWLDAAGVRADATAVESRGIERALSAAQTADIVLWLVDGSGPDRGLAGPEVTAGRPLVLHYRTKADLEESAHWRHHPVFGQAAAICALRQSDVGEVKAQIAAAIASIEEPASSWQVVISRDRHAAALVRAAEHGERAAIALRSGALLELCAADLRDAAEAVAEITGEIAPDDVLEAVFAQFCIGK